jgi:ATP-dependent DNA helicase RecQ
MIQHKKYLKKFGLSKFRPMQEEIINSIMSGTDTVGILPTGAGKSLCYQLPATALPGITIVISPLISLMKDQIDSLNSKGIGAVAINSTITTQAEKREINRKLFSGEVKLLYIAPERIETNGFISYLQKLPLSLLAIDEAHSISAWGHQFRPAYSRIHLLREAFPKLPCIAVTATATPKVRDDIVNQLKMDSPAIFQGSFDRPNLYIEVQHARGGDQQIIDILRLNPHKGSTIIYCLARKDTEILAEILCEKGFSAAAYHAGITKVGERARIQENFISGRVPIVVGTNALGMGIDKPDVRLVIHQAIPKTMENYYQEAGRAGRDGKFSKCIVLFDNNDANRWDYIIERSTENKDGEINYTERYKQKALLQQVVDYCESEECRRKQILNYFSEEFSGNCQKCDVCL